MVMEYKPLFVMSQNDIEIGDSVEWTIDIGLYTKECSGEVLETGLEEFGYSDVIKVRTNDHEPEAFIRPKDLE